MNDVELTRADKLRLTGIKKYGSEAAWRKALSDGAKKADRTTPRGFAVIDPEFHKELSSRGGKKSKRGTNASQKTANSQNAAEGQT